VNLCNSSDNDALVRTRETPVIADVELLSVEFFFVFAKYVIGSMLYFIILSDLRVNHLIFLSILFFWEIHSRLQLISWRLKNSFSIVIGKIFDIVLHILNNCNLIECLYASLSFILRILSINVRLALFNLRNEDFWKRLTSVDLKFCKCRGTIFLFMLW